MGISLLSAFLILVLISVTILQDSAIRWNSTIHSKINIDRFASSTKKIYSEMTTQPKKSKTLHIVLWILQVLLASMLLWAGFTKLFEPIVKLSTMWPWTGQVPVAFVKFTGVVDILGAMGLILPSLSRIKPKLTPIAAIALCVLMVCAIVFHVARGEASHIGINIMFIGIAAFVAWGRLTKAVIITK